MKILHLVDSMHFGGAQSLLQGLFESQRNNLDIFLYSLRHKEHEININHPNFSSCSSSSKFSIKPLKEIISLIRDNNITILHCHLPRSQLFGIIIKKFYYPKIILIFHEHGRIFRRNIIYEQFLKLSSPDSFISVSEATKSQLISRSSVYPNKIFVLKNFINDRYFAQRNSDNSKMPISSSIVQKSSGGNFLIGYVGRLRKLKGCEYLINSLPYLDFKYKVLVVGDGPEKSHLIKLVYRYGLEKKVSFLGHVSNPESVYAMLDVLIVPSLSESFGLSVVEAQAMGVPIIGSDIAGLNETIVNNYNGLLFRKADSKDLADKIKSLKLNTRLRKKIIQGGINSSKNYNLKDYSSRLNEIYREINDAKN